MKTIKLLSNDKINSRAVLLNVVTSSPTGMKIEQMRSRIRLLDAIEKLPEDAVKLELEDADHSALIDVLQSTNWNIADRFLLSIIDAVLKPEVEEVKK